MPLTRTVRVPSMVGYVPPLGFRIVTIRELEDGSCEVTLEPVVLPSKSSGWGRFSRPSLSCDDCNGYLYDVVNDKALGDPNDPY